MLHAMMVAESTKWAQKVKSETGPGSKAGMVKTKPGWKVTLVGMYRVVTNDRSSDGNSKWYMTMLILTKVAP